MQRCERLWPDERDLDLARKALSGDAATLSALDRRLATGVARGATGQNISPNELQQLLRERLLVGADPKLGRYDGTGPLSAWLRAVAVRVASNARRGGGAEQPVPTVPESAFAEPTAELCRRWPKTPRRLLRTRRCSRRERRRRGRR